MDSNGKNVEIIRGFRTCGLDDVYMSDSTVEVQPGMVITQDGALATLTDASHTEVGVAIQGNIFGRGGYDEASGKIPVMISNFVMRTQIFTPAVYIAGEAITVVAGIPKKAVGTDPIWGRVTAIGVEAGTIDIRVNY
ncbi:hypothetical protein JHD46_08240 [Sulfurimonas sp. SAG-AH-194-C20]|nr:hypothetical protein [Sulfurimonas sp. SAG-AH-194-C20]MDF1879624.1 hypothetical protein [Sulfurimonas sp. SAG-AH-194-C20]